MRSGLMLIPQTMWYYDPLTFQLLLGRRVDGIGLDGVMRFLCCIVYKLPLRFVPIKLLL